MVFTVKEGIKLKCTFVQDTHDETSLVPLKLSRNPLIRKIWRVLDRIKDYKIRVRVFYFEIVLSTYPCPACNGRLHMIGQSKCSCSCDNVFDPTLAFQKSACCDAKLVRKIYHYACTRCNNIVPSRFLQSEKLFDKVYFKEMMQDSRKRKQKKREEIRKLLTESRSDTLPLLEDPDLESIPGFIQDLNGFIKEGSGEVCQFSFNIKDDFNMNNYRSHILSILNWDNMLFSEIAPLIKDRNRDKIWRFITLVFMQNDSEVELTQHGSDLLVQKLYNETYN